jgi:cupin fold WbuC family metalloprotein
MAKFPAVLLIRGEFRGELMQVKEINPEVFFATDQIVKMGTQDLAFLKERAEGNPRGRVRLCAHRNVEALQHEMITVIRRGAYLIPEKHLTRMESYHIIEGMVDVVIFDEVGNISEVVQLGEYPSERQFFYRLSDPFYHTLIIKSDFLVLHETVTGPFDRADTVPAPWAPADGNHAESTEYMARLTDKVEQHLASLEPAGNGK